MNLHTDNVVAEPNIPYLVASSFTAAFLLLLLVYYACKYRPSAPIVAILALLLFNDFLQTIFELPTYLAKPPNILCLTSIVGTTFFRLAANYWLIFITRLIYRQKSTPGKYMDLSKYISKSLLITYFPSVAVSLLIFIVANLDDTQSEVNCWRVISEKVITDYVIYLSSFVLPNFIALLFIIRYLVGYFKTRPNHHSLFVIYPVVAIPFLAYYLFIKLLIFLGQFNLDPITQVPFIVQPLTHGVIFAFVLRNLSKGKSPQSSDITIKDESNHQSFGLPQQS